MKRKFILTLVTLIILSFAVLTPLPVEAIGGYCTMRSEIVIAAEDVERFGFVAGAPGAPAPAPGAPPGAAADRIIRAGETVGYGVVPPAAPGAPAPAPGAPPAAGALNHTTPMWGLICMIGTVGYITRIVFWILVPVFLILALIGGFKIMTAAGDDKKVTGGKNMILYAVIGFVLILLIRGFPAMIRFIVGM